MHAIIIGTDDKQTKEETMTPLITKTIRIPLGVMAKVEQGRKEQSFNAYCVEALREKAERDGDNIMTPRRPA